MAEDGTNGSDFAHRNTLIRALSHLPDAHRSAACRPNVPVHWSTWPTKSTVWLWAERLLDEDATPILIEDESFRLLALLLTSAGFGPLRIQYDQSTHRRNMITIETETAEQGTALLSIGWVVILFNRRR